MSFIDHIQVDPGLIKHFNNKEYIQFSDMSLICAYCGKKQTLKILSFDRNEFGVIKRITYELCDCHEEGCKQK